MIIYLFLLALTGIAAFGTNNKTLDKICIFLIFCVSAFRAESVGWDTITYMQRGSSEYATGLKTLQYFYIFLTSIKPTGSSHLLIIVFSTVTTWGLYFASKKFGVRPVVTFFFFILFEYFTLSLNIARQYAAISLLLVGFSYLQDEGVKKYLYFLIYTGLACGFHSSAPLALIAIPLCLLNFSEIEKKYYVVLFIILYVLIKFLLRDFYLSWVQLADLSDDISGYQYYFEQAESMNLSLGGTIIASTTIILNVFVFLSLLKYDTREIRIIVPIFFASIIIDLFFADLWGNLGRLKYCIDIINVIAYAKYMQYEKSSKRMVVLTLTLLFFGYDLIYMLLGSNNAYGSVHSVFWSN